MLPPNLNALQSTSISGFILAIAVENVKII